jgi:branched-subunit amino acid transport protein
MSTAWLTIVLAGAGTFAMRASFLAAAGRLAEVPPGVQRLLRQIPSAALASLVVPAFVRPDGQLSLLQPELAAGALASLVAWRTRNVALTLAVGLASLALAEAVGWG